MICPLKICGMTDPELTQRNFFRINLINWSLTIPMLILFSWPYYLVCQWLRLNELLSYFGALLFAFPFMITILHGHVTMALGALHRNHYYQWLSRFPLTYGIMFHPVMFRTRFRLSLILLSLAILIIGFFGR
jgi:hypothetical protein